MSTEVRTRFAPSPTGFLHIGGVRTALFNYLYAKKNGGSFILRIEDTDEARSDTRYTEPIIDGLKWLGLEWDEGPGEDSETDKGSFGPYYQSRRRGIYDAALVALIETGAVYRCFCSPEELTLRREEAVREGRDSGYDRRCRSLAPEDIKKFEEDGRGYAWRIKAPAEGTVSFEDIIKGRVEVPASTLQDFVIVKNDGMPTYNFACVVDDSRMKISHVIRGDDHISNTPKQIILYGAMKETAPCFAHLPQVHGTDGKRLSKRTGAVSLSEYRNMGYLPEALRNYLALLGWSTQDSQQIFEWNELIEKFDLARVGRSAGVFDIEKLCWMNGKFIRITPAEELARKSLPWLREASLVGENKDISSRIIAAVELEKEKISLLSEVPEKIDFLIKEDILYDEKAVKKRLQKEGVKDILGGILEKLKDTEDFSAGTLESLFEEYCREKELGAGKLYHPVRVAVSGRMTGPGVFDLLVFAGREKVLERIEYALKELVSDE